MVIVRSSESLIRGTFTGVAATAARAGALSEPFPSEGAAVEGPEVAGPVEIGRFGRGGCTCGFGPLYFSQTRITKIDSSDATRIRNSGVNLSFCPGTTLKNAPHAESLESGSRWLRRAESRPKPLGPGRSRPCAKEDGTAAVASSPAKSHAPRQSARSLRRHTASRWDESGSSPQTEWTDRSCRT